MKSEFEYAVVIVTFNSAAQIDALLDSIEVASRNVVVQIVVVDNGSTDDTVARLRGREGITILEEPSNPGYAAALNSAFRKIGTADAVMVCNPDVVVSPEALEQLGRALFTEPSAGIVVPKVLSLEGVLYPSLRREPTTRRQLGDALLGSRMPRRTEWGEVIYPEACYEVDHQIDWATGAVLLVSTLCWRSIGGWDERFFLYSEETDFFARARLAGWRPRFCSRAVVTHEGGGSGASTGLEALMLLNRVRYARKHGGVTSALAVWGIAVVSLVVRWRRAGTWKKARVLLSPWRWADFVQQLRGAAMTSAARD